MPHEINRYQRKLSGPIIDRIDLYTEVSEVKHASLLSNDQEENSETIRTRIVAARNRQQKRLRDPLKSNATLSNQDIKKFLKLSDDAEKLLNQAAERLGISARSYMRILKVSQTIADLEGSDVITQAHISESLQYRRTTVN